MQHKITLCKASDESHKQGRGLVACMNW